MDNSEHPLGKTVKQQCFQREAFPDPLLTLQTTYWKIAHKLLQHSITL